MALFFSAFFSGAETALISVSRIKLEVWVRRGVKGAKKTFAFLHHPEHFLTTTLVGTNIAVVAASSLMAFHLEHYLNGFAITAVSSFFLLFFGEILPKSIARDRAAVFMLRSSVFIRFFYLLLYPIIFCVMGLSRLLLKVLGLERESVKRFFPRKDLEMLVREGERSGLVDVEEMDLISRLIIRGNHRVKEIMVPRTEIIAVKHEETIDRISRIFETTGYSRLPVMGKDMDEIIGMINVKDVLLEKPSTVKQILRNVLYVPESRLIASLMKEMQDERIGMAIVVDEYGGTAGLVTLEDIVEEFFGEIQDEFDEVSSPYRKIGSKQIEVNANVQIEELNDRFGLKLPEGDYHTVGGLLMERFGHIPKRGEQVKMPTCTLVVLSATRRTVDWVRVIIRENEESRAA